MNMNSNEFAAILNGSEYRDEMSAHLDMIAREDGLVVVFGASDDLMEFRGAIYDEVGCYDGGTAYLNSKGLLVNQCDEANCPYFEIERANAVTIRAIWDNEGYSWTYETKIPHELCGILLIEL